MRLRAVKLHLEEGFTQEMVAEELGVSAAVYKWVARYRLQGEEALKTHLSGRPGAQLPQPIRDKIVELKKGALPRDQKNIPTTPAGVLPASQCGDGPQDPPCAVTEVKGSDLNKQFN